MKKILLLLAIMVICSFAYAEHDDSKVPAKGESEEGTHKAPTGDWKLLDVGEPTPKEESEMEREEHSEEMFDNEEPVLGDPEEGSTRWEQDF